MHRAERRARMPEKSRIECDRTHSVKSPEGQQTSRKARSGRYAAFRRPGHSTSRWAKQRRWTRSSCSYPLCRAKPLTRQRESTTDRADSLDLSLYCSPRIPAARRLRSRRGAPHGAQRRARPRRKSPRSTIVRFARMWGNGRKNDAIRRVTVGTPGEAGEAAAMSSKAAMSLRRG